MTSIGGAGDRMSPALPRSTGMAIVELDESHLPDAARHLDDRFGKAAAGVEP
jgi:hypothetical protein